MVAHCPAQNIRLQPYYSGDPELKVSPMQDVDEWLSALQSCVDAASNLTLNWVVVTFWSDVDELALSGQSKTGEYLLVTKYWEAQGENAPIPPGQRIRPDDFVITMRKMQWDAPKPCFDEPYAGAPHKGPAAGVDCSLYESTSLQARLVYFLRGGLRAFEARADALGLSRDQLAFVVTSLLVAFCLCMLVATRWMVIRLRRHGRRTAVQEEFADEKRKRS